MFHLGPGVLCPRDSIVGVFDLDTATVSRLTRDFLRRAQEAGAVIAVGDDLPQSFVVTSVFDNEASVFDNEASVFDNEASVFDNEAAENIYLSPQSSANLAKKLLTSP